MKRIWLNENRVSELNLNPELIPYLNVGIPIDKTEGYKCDLEAEKLKQIAGHLNKAYSEMEQVFQDDDDELYEVFEENVSALMAQIVIGFARNIPNLTRSELTEY